MTTPPTDRPRPHGLPSPRGIFRPLLLAALVGPALVSLAAVGSGTWGAGPGAPQAAWSPPAAWRTIEPYSFERLVEDDFTAAATKLDPAAASELAVTKLDPAAASELAVTKLDPAAASELAAGLDDPDVLVAVRAAVLLGRSRSDDAAAILLARLERRLPSPTRGGDAGDVVAAAALARFPDAERFAPRLCDLALGAGAHPDLEVRVECGAAALALGADEPIPFLLQVLRIGTQSGRSDTLDFEPSPTTAWARGRAAEALSGRAGVPLAYEPDAALADREQQAERLARLLGR